jgi:hypothetical protein
VLLTARKSAAFFAARFSKLAEHIWVTIEQVGNDECP